MKTTDRTAAEPPAQRTYTVKDDDNVLAEHIAADEVCELMADIDGHASIYDDEDGSLVVADTDGDPATIAALAMLLEDHERTVIS